MQRESFIVYKSFYALMKLLPRAERLKMFEAIFDYGFNGTEPTFKDETSAAFWETILPQLKANNKRWENGCKGGAPKGNQNARKNNQDDDFETTKKQPEVDLGNNLNGEDKITDGGLSKTTKKQPNENENENENENVCIKNAPARRHPSFFAPPTVFEVKKYCEQRKNNVDAERFVDFYAAKNWYIGKNKMCDWQAAVRTWERDDAKSASQAPKEDDYLKHEYTKEQLDGVVRKVEALDDDWGD